MLIFSVKNLFRRKSRTLLATLGISIGITMIITLVGLSQGIQQEFSDAIEQIKSIVVLEKGVFLGSQSKVPKEALNKIKKISGVKEVSPEIYYTPRTIDGKDGGGFGRPTSIIGFEPSSIKNFESPPFGFKVSVGRVFRNDNDKGVAVIGQTVSNSFSKKVGQRINLDGRDFKIIGIISEDSSLNNDIAINIDDARELSGLDSKYYSGLLIEPTNFNQIDFLAKKLNIIFSDLNAQTGADFLEQFSSFFAIIDTMTITIGGVAAIIGGIGVLNTMLMSVLERTKEIGVLKALGWNDLTILKMIIIESISISVLGLILGGVIGIIVIYQILPLFGLVGVINLQVLILACLFSISLGVIGGLYPAIRASKMNPIEAFKNE